MEFTIKYSFFLCILNALYDSLQKSNEKNKKYIPAKLARMYCLRV